MIQINYPEMLQSIKMSIFTADHSALYSLSCSIACIAASFGLLTWYNRMLNDPYGRFDLAAIVRALLILFLTTNFYYTVMVPLDGVTHLVARGITAWADADKDGLMGKINEVYEQAEESRKKDTLLGAFEDEMEGEGTTENVDGLSYESSAVVQSLAEAALSNGGEKPGFFKRLWAGAKGFVSAKVGEVINYGGSILSVIASVVVKLTQYVLLSVSSVCLMILGLMGPFVFAFALIPGLEGGIKAWLARYIQLSFWVPVTSFVDMVNIKMKGAMLAGLHSTPFISQLAAPFHLLILDLVTIACLLFVPTIASWAVHSSGATELAGKITSVGKKAIALASKV